MDVESFTSCRAIVISGGIVGRQKLSLQVEKTIDNTDFVSMSQRDLKYRFDLPMAASTYLKNKRDAVIDDLLKTFVRRQDPLAEVDVDPIISDRERSSLFAEAEVPDIITVTVPETTIGEKVLIRTMFTMLSCSKRSTHVSLVPSHEAIAWISGAGKCNWDELKDQHSEDQFADMVNDWLPEGVSAKICDKYVVLRTYTGRKLSGGRSVLRQVSIQRALYDDDQDIKLAIDMQARVILRKRNAVADIRSVAAEAGP